MAVSPHPGLAAWTALRASGARRAALVTLVRADGGASRALGTALALADDGRVFGTVTIGGCADGRALDVAREVLSDGAMRRVTLPLGEEDALALGLGCAGDVDLLVEAVDLDGEGAIAPALDAAAEMASRGERVVIALPLAGASHRTVASLRSGHSSESVDEVSLVGRKLVGAALADPRAESGVHGRDDARWFVQVLAPVRSVIIVGATDVAAALLPMMAMLGWRTLLLDPREERLAERRFDQATERIASIPSDTVAARLGEASPPAVVVVAHDYRVELPVLRLALRSASPYVGMLGSRKRGTGTKRLLVEEGVEERATERLRTPIGMPIGAQGPAEIAVSIVADLIATWRSAEGRP